MADLFGRKVRAVADLDLQNVRLNATRRNDWSPTHAEALEAAYRRFLYLFAKHPKQTFVPWSNDLDLFWHEHILDTRKYAEDCNEVLGFFLHHDPNIRHTPSVEDRARRETIRLFREEYTGHTSAPPSRMRWLVADPANLAAIRGMESKAA